MSRKFGIGILILCFGSSTLNFAWADEVMQASPAMAQPYEVQALTQQILDRDRQNRDEEIAIQGLIEENDKLTQETLSRQEDEGLQKIDQTMLSYRHALLARDQARILANSEQWKSRYGDLVALTEDADSMTVHHELVDKDELMEEKYKLLSDLKDEMTDLNEKLENRQGTASNQKDTIIEGFKNIAQQQEDKIQMLTQKLDEMDQKISHFDEILAQKDQQIELLKDNAARSQREVSVKDDMLKDLENQLAFLQEQSKELTVKNEQMKTQAEQMEGLSQQSTNQNTAYENDQAQVLLLKGQIQQQSLDLKDKDKFIKLQADQIDNLLAQIKKQSYAPQIKQADLEYLKSQLKLNAVDLKNKDEAIHSLIQELAAVQNKGEHNQQRSQQYLQSIQQAQQEVQKIKDDFARRFKDYDKYESAIAALKNEVSQLGLQLSQKQNQIDLLKEELEQKITELNAKGSNANAAIQPVVKQGLAFRPQEKNINGNPATEIVELPPVIVQPNELGLSPVIVQSNGAQQPEKILQDRIAELQAQREILRKELIRQLKKKANSNAGISPVIVQSRKRPSDKMLQDRIEELQAQREELKKLLDQQQDQMAQLEKTISQTRDLAASNNLQDEVNSLKNQMQQQAGDLKARDESIRWLNQILDAAKKKAEYYRLTAQLNNLKEQQAQNLKNIAPEIVELPPVIVQSKETQQEEKALQNQITDLQAQRDELKKELARQEVQNANSKSPEVAIPPVVVQSYNLQQSQQLLVAEIAELKAQREELKKELALQQGQSAPVVPPDDRLNLARQLIGLHEQEADLLNEKSMLALQEFTLLDRHVARFENRIKVLLADRRLHDIGLRNQLVVLENESGQEQRDIDSLKAQLEESINNQKDVERLQSEIQDLKSQLQDKEEQIYQMKVHFQSGEDSDTLKQQLAEEQDRENMLKQQLDSKIAESGKMTPMLEDYQNKLESKDSAYNEELGQNLVLKKYLARTEQQLVDLNARLQEKEAQIVKIKKDMYELQQTGSAQNMDLQAKDLSLSIEQQKKMDAYQARINALQADSAGQVQEITSLKTDLALARQALQGMPSSDEIDFLRTGLKKATAQLKERDETIAQIKANADEYAKAFKEQSQEFQSLKDQLFEAQQEIHLSDEDLKTKDLTIVHLKELSAIKEADWEASSKDLNEKRHQVELLKEELENKITELKKQGGFSGQIQDLQAQLKDKTLAVQNLNDQLQNAQDELARKNEDLKYKDMAITRLKDLSRMSGGDLQAEVAKLTQKIDADEKELRRKTHEGKAGALQAKLEQANLKIQELQAQLDQLALPKNNAAEIKLKQALDKIDEQGKVINILVQKLQNAGQSVDLSKVSDKQ